MFSNKWPRILEMLLSHQIVFVFACVTPVRKPNICLVFMPNIDLRVLSQKERSELLRAFTVWKLRHCDEKREVSRLTSDFHYKLELFELCMCYLVLNFQFFVVVQSGQSSFRKQEHFSY